MCTCVHICACVYLCLWLCVHECVHVCVHVRVRAPITLHVSVENGEPPLQGGVGPGWCSPRQASHTDPETLPLTPLSLPSGASSTPPSILQRPGPGDCLPQRRLPVLGFQSRPLMHLPCHSADEDLLEFKSRGAPLRSWVVLPQSAISSGPQHRGRWQSTPRGTGLAAVILAILIRLCVCW